MRAQQEVRSRAASMADTPSAINTAAAAAAHHARPQLVRQRVAARLQLRQQRRRDGDVVAAAVEGGEGGCVCCSGARLAARLVTAAPRSRLQTLPCTLTPPCTSPRQLPDLARVAERRRHDGGAGVVVLGRGMGEGGQGRSGAGRSSAWARRSARSAHTGAHHSDPNPLHTAIPICSSTPPGHLLVVAVDALHGQHPRVLVKGAQTTARDRRWERGSRLLRLRKQASRPACLPASRRQREPLQVALQERGRHPRTSCAAYSRLCVFLCQSMMRPTKGETSAAPASAHAWACEGAGGGQLTLLQNAAQQASRHAAGKHPSTSSAQQQPSATSPPPLPTAPDLTCANEKRSVMLQSTPSSCSISHARMPSHVAAICGGVEEGVGACCEDTCGWQGPRRPVLVAPTVHGIPPPNSPQRPPPPLALMYRRLGSTPRATYRSSRCSALSYVACGGGGWQRQGGEGGGMRGGEQAAERSPSRGTRPGSRQAASAPQLARQTPHAPCRRGSGARLPRWRRGPARC